MVGIFLLIGVIVLFFLLKTSRTKESHEVFDENEEVIIKKKEVLKEKVQNDLRHNKIDHVFISSHSKKYHYKGCRYYQENTMEETPLDIAKKNGYIPCKICNHKKNISA